MINFGACEDRPFARIPYVLLLGMGVKEIKKKKKIFWACIYQIQ